LAINVAVWMGWQVPGLAILWEELFLWKNDSLKKGQWWLAVTPSFSHASLAHLTGTRV
jgi:membrane associated rhomboid family serine protease